MPKRLLRGITFVLLLAAGTLCGQTPAAAPAFEVASIKPAPPLDPAAMRSGKMHVGVKIDGARVDIGNLSLTDLLCFAYTVKPYQVSGPDWMGAQRFNVLAKLPEGASESQAPEMLQALLAERFKLTLHRETKEHPVYALVVGKNGPKLKESPPDSAAPSADSAAPAGPGAGGGPGELRVSRDGKGMTVNSGPMGSVRISMSPDSGMHVEATKATMAMFVDILSRFVDRPVVDMTELKGTYQVALDISMDDMKNAARSAGMMVPGGLGPPPGGGDLGRGPAVPASSDPPPSAIFANVQQLGLKLEPRKEPLATLIIDHAERTPTEN